MPPLRSFDDLDGKERGEKKTDDLRAMTTLGPRTLELRVYRCHRFNFETVIMQVCTLYFTLEKARCRFTDIASLLILVKHALVANFKRRKYVF